MPATVNAAASAIVAAVVILLNKRCAPCVANAASTEKESSEPAGAKK